MVDDPARQSRALAAEYLVHTAAATRIRHTQRMIARQRLAAGVTKTRIARDLGVQRPTLDSWLAAPPAPPPPGHGANRPVANVAGNIGPAIRELNRWLQWLTANSAPATHPGHAAPWTEHHRMHAIALVLPDLAEELAGHNPGTLIGSNQLSNCAARLATMAIHRYLDVPGTLQTQDGIGHGNQEPERTHLR